MTIFGPFKSPPGQETKIWTLQTRPKKSLGLPFWAQLARIARKMPFKGSKIAKRLILAVFSIFPIYFQYKIAENQFCRSVAPFLPLLILIFGFLNTLGIPGDN